MFFSHSCDKNTKYLKDTFNFVIRFIFLFSISIFFLQNLICISLSIKKITTVMCFSHNTEFRNVQLFKTCFT